MKPILFNTEMVQAILDGRKSVTRRVVKPRPGTDDIVYKNHDCGKWFISPDNDCSLKIEVKPTYRPGSVLYVRETWVKVYSSMNEFEYFYKANVHTPDPLPIKWCPSIQMPKDAARLFLRVTDVRVERLQDITEEQALSEGAKKEYQHYYDNVITALEVFQRIWDSTIKKADLPIYGWNANPWVWVIEFERISKEEAQKGGEK